LKRDAFYKGAGTAMTEFFAGTFVLYFGTRRR
jgi:hypothetical protein